MQRLIFNDKRRVGRWAKERLGHRAPFGDYYAMGVEQGGKLVSAIVVQSWTSTNAVCHIVVAKPTRLLPELVNHTILYAREQMGLNRLTAFISLGNEKSLLLTTNVGFVTEGLLLGAGQEGENLVIRRLDLHQFQPRTTSRQRVLSDLPDIESET